MSEPIDAIIGLAELYNRQLTEDVQAMWIAALDGTTYEECRDARNRWMKCSRWMPRPAEILEIIQTARLKSRRESDKQQARNDHRINWTQAVRSTFNIPHGKRLLDYVDEQSKAGRDLDDIVEEVCKPNERVA